MDEKFTKLSALHSVDTRSNEERLTAVTNYHDIMATRHSIRQFSDKPVPRNIIETAIKTARLAPSGANHQPWHFCLVGDPAVKKQIRLAAEEEEKEFYSGRAGQEWLDALTPIGTNWQKPYLETAPWLIIMFAQKRGGASTEDDKKNYYINESCGIALGLLISSLHIAGLATLTHTPAPMGFLRKILNRPDTEKPYMLLIAGHPHPEANIPNHALKKKTLDDVLTRF